jgi:histidinol phosphatase-like enzyme
VPPEDVEIFPATRIGLKKLRRGLQIVHRFKPIRRRARLLHAGRRGKCERHLCAELARDGIRFEKIYIAPEAPDQPSRGRKPSPQFLFDARDEFDLNLAESFMAGDKLIDMECGWNAGVKKSMLVRTGYGAEPKKKRLPREISRFAVVVDWI